MSITSSSRSVMLTKRDTKRAFVDGCWQTPGLSVTERLVCFLVDDRHADWVTLHARPTFGAVLADADVIEITGRPVNKEVVMPLVLSPLRSGSSRGSVGAGANPTAAVARARLPIRPVLSDPERDEVPRPAKVRREWD